VRAGLPSRARISFCAAIICSTSSISFSASTSGERVGFQSRISSAERLLNSPSRTVVTTKNSSSPPQTTVKAFTAFQSMRRLP
jgi:hypothetical protein